MVKRVELIETREISFTYHMSPFIGWLNIKCQCIMSMNVMAWNLHNTIYNIQAEFNKNQTDIPVFHWPFMFFSQTSTWMSSTFAYTFFFFLLNFFFSSHCYVNAMLINYNEFRTCCISCFIANVCDSTRHRYTVHISSVCFLLWLLLLLYIRFRCKV